MRTDKTTANKLRKQGKSYQEISSELGMSKSTLNQWFGQKTWSKKIKKQLSAKAQTEATLRMKNISKKAKEAREKLYSQKRNDAEILYRKFSKEKLFIAGLMMYWGEGDSKLANGQIRVANSNPLLIKYFHLFLKRYLPELKEKIKMYLVLYPDLSDSACKKHWSITVGISLDKFFKSHYIIGHSAKRTLPYGIGTIIITSRANKEIICRWLELKQKEIKNLRV